MKSDKFRQLLHFIAGLSVIIRFFEAFEKAQLVASGIFIFVGILFLLFAGIQEWLQNKLRRKESFLFMMEAAVFGYMCYHFRDSSRDYLPVGFAALAIFYIIFAFKVLFGRKKKYRKHSSDLP